MKEQLWKFLFPADPGRWLSLLRVGLGFQLILYAWSLRQDWSFLLQSAGKRTAVRTLTEAIVSSQTEFTPRLGWVIAIGDRLGGTESTVLSVVWFFLFATGCLLLLGLLCRPAAIIAWFLYLCSVKSGGLFAYGVDNFTTIGLFYLMIAPLPDEWSLDGRMRKKRVVDLERLGFHRRVLQLHLCLIYFFGGISKSLGVDWWNGNSIWRALTRPPFDLVPADVLIRFAPLLPAIGIVVCLLETGYPVLIWPRRTRLIWLIGILLMHLSIGLTMGLYLFALIMIVLNLAAFGPEFLLRSQNTVRSRRKNDDDSFGEQGGQLEESG